MALINGKRRAAVKECKLALKTSSSLVKNMLQSRGKKGDQSKLPRIPLSQAEKAKSGGDFVLFTKLPKEIQIQIWKIVIANSRFIIQVIERAGQHWLTGKCTFRKQSWRKYFQFIKNQPAVRQVCPLSRELATSAWGPSVVWGPQLQGAAEYNLSGREILEIYLTDCSPNRAQSPSFGGYDGWTRDYALLVEAFGYVDMFGIKTIAMDLDKWSSVETEYEWCDRISTFLKFPEILTLERIVLFYSESNMCSEKLALTRSMTGDFVTFSDSPLSVIRDDAIRKLIRTDNRFEGCAVENWKMPTFEFVLKSEWRKWSGIWADTHDTCLHSIPYMRTLRYRIPSYRCELDHAKWRMKGLLHWRG